MPLFPTLRFNTHNEDKGCQLDNCYYMHIHLNLHIDYISRSPGMHLKYGNMANILE